MEDKKEIQEKRDKINKELAKLDEAIKKNKKKWIEADVISLVANCAILGKKLGFRKPSDVLDKANQLIDEWYETKSEAGRRYLKVEDLYDSWAKTYDNDVNLAIFLEEKVTNKWFDFKNKDILDLGCGTGRNTIDLAKKNKVTAIDFSKEMLKIAKIKAKKANVKIDFQQGDITKINPNKKFDVIISMLVLDHIENLNKVLDVVSKSSKIGTEFIVSNIHPYWIYRTVMAKEGKAEIATKRKTNQYYHPLEEYIKLLRQKGFELVGYKDLNFEQKYAKIKKFDKFIGSLNKPIAVVYRFRRIK